MAQTSDLSMEILGEDPTATHGACSVLDFLRRFTAISDGAVDRVLRVAGETGERIETVLTSLGLRVCP